VPGPALLERTGVTEQDEVGSRLPLDDLEPVVPQMALEKATRVGLGFRKQQRGRHVNESSAVFATRPDVLSCEIVTKLLQPTASDGGRRAG
jgi:hypothetical protein